MKLRRRLSTLRGFPYRSHSLSTDEEWIHLGSRFEGHTVIVYGTSIEALVYTDDPARNLAVFELAILDGVVVR